MTEDQEEIEQIVETVHSRIPDDYEDDVERDDIEETVRKMSGLPEQEILRAATRNVAGALGVDKSALYSESSSGGEQSVRQVDSLEADEEWVTLEVRAFHVSEGENEAVSQEGYLADESGVVSFASWEKSDVPDLTDGQAYRLESAVTNRYRGNVSVNLNSSTEITELEEGPDVSREDVDDELFVQTVGNVVSLSQNSGLQEDEDSNIDSIRVTAQFDTGDEVRPLIIEADELEELTGLSLEEAKEIAMENLDRGAVRRELENRLVGRYFHVTGRQTDGDFVVAEDISHPSEVEFDEQLLVSMRSMEV